MWLARGSPGRRRKNETVPDMTEPGAAATTCEAFAATAARYPRKVAPRTPGTAVRITWEQYAGGVRQARPAGRMA
jgi:hypothetical protein